MTFQTIDLDNTTKDQFNYVIRKLRACKRFSEIKWTLSARMNGYHIEYLCSYPEDTCPCRFCLDDQNRFHFDAVRLKHRQNIIFQEKAVRHNGTIKLRLTIEPNCI